MTKNIKNKYNLCVYAVPHKVFQNSNYKLMKSVITKDGAIYDVKNALPNNLKLKKLYNMKKILITGCAGFIGFHASQRFISEKFNVIGIDNLNDYYDVELKKSY